MVVVHKSKRNASSWSKVVDGLRLSGTKVYNEPQEADVSISLCGMYENPAVLKGKRVLCFDVEDWRSTFQPPYGWKLYQVVLEEYYDEFVNLTGLDVKQKVIEINKYCEANKSRS